MLSKKFMFIYFYVFKKKIIFLKSLFFNISHKKFSFMTLNNDSNLKFKLLFLKLIIQFLVKLPSKFILEKLISSWRYQHLSYYTLKFKFNFKKFLRLFNINFKNFQDKQDKDFTFIKSKLFINNLKLKFFFYNYKLAYLKFRNRRFFRKAVLFKKFLKRKKILIQSYRVLNFYFLKRFILIPKLNQFKTQIFRYTLNFVFKKNNLFLIFSNSLGQVIKFLSAGRLTNGKKKVSTLTSKNLARIMSRLIYRSLKITTRSVSYLELKPVFYLFFIVNKLFYTPILKTAIMTLKQYNVPISYFIDNVRLPHSKGLKRKKMRRV